jgi:hypothetical protein
MTPNKQVYIGSDPILLGVSKMLQVLKNHVKKPNKRDSLNINFTETHISTNLKPVPTENDIIEKCKEDLNAREEEIRQLKAEIFICIEEIENKDSMLNMLTEGLKEVEVPVEEETIALSVATAAAAAI